MTINQEAPKSMYPDLEKTQRQKIREHNQNENIEPEIKEEIEEEPTKVEQKKKGKLRRCGKWLLCLPLVAFACCGKFACKRACRCLTCPARCLCPCF